MKDITLNELGVYLKKNKITPSEALRIIQRKKEGTRGDKFNWKMFRFTLYIWARVAENNLGKLGKRIDTVRKLCKSEKYKRLYATFPLEEYDYEQEVKKLTQLLAEPRQDKYFKKGLYKFEHRHDLIPQIVLDKLR